VTAPPRYRLILLAAAFVIISMSIGTLFGMGLGSFAGVPSATRWERTRRSSWAPSPSR